MVARGQNRLNVPDLDGMVMRSADNPQAVWAEGALVTTLACPRSVSVSSPVAASQTLIVLSPDPLAIRQPSGERHAGDIVGVPSEREGCSMLVDRRI